LILEHVFQAVHDFGVGFKEVTEFWISEGEGVVNHEDVGVGGDIFGGSNFVVLVFLVVQDLKEVTSIVGGFCEFEMEGLDEGGREL
jgi:hypothetical protein